MKILSAILAIPMAALCSEPLDVGVRIKPDSRKTDREIMTSSVVREIARAAGKAALLPDVTESDLEQRYSKMLRFRPTISESDIKKMRRMSEKISAKREAVEKAKEEMGKRGKGKTR